MLRLAAAVLMLAMLSGCISGLTALYILEGTAAGVTIGKNVFDLKTDFGKPLLPVKMRSEPARSCAT